MHVPVLHRTLGILLKHNQHSIFAHLIWYWSQSRWNWVNLSEHEICTYQSIANSQCVVWYCWSSGKYHDPHPGVSNTETQRGYSWRSDSLCCQILRGIWLKFWNNWDLQSRPECGSRICPMITVTNCETLLMHHSSPGRPWVGHATNVPPKCTDPSLRCTVCCGFIHSDHNYFYCEAADVLNTDCYLWRHLTLWCRRPIPLGHRKYMNHSLIGIPRLHLKRHKLSAWCKLVNWRKVTLDNFAINAQTWAICNLTYRDIY